MAPGAGPLYDVLFSTSDPECRCYCCHPQSPSYEQSRTERISPTCGKWQKWDLNLDTLHHSPPDPVPLQLQRSCVWSSCSKSQLFLRPCGSFQNFPCAYAGGVGMVQLSTLTKVCYFLKNFNTLLSSGPAIPLPSATPRKVNTYAYPQIRI
jgi:hypothetical protein